MVRCVDQLDLSGKRVFVRVDFDCPVGPDGAVLDDRRIRAALPTLRLAIDRGARLVVASHRGRPRGRPPGRDSLEPAAARLAGLLEREVRLADDCVGDGVKKLLLDMRNGEVVMLENLRLHRDEEANSADFARALGALCEAYVNEAFALAHRPSASTVGMLPFVAGPKAAGLGFKKELERLGTLLQEPSRPFVAVLGGARLSDRARLLESLLPRLDALLLGGATAYPFLAAEGAALGATPWEESMVETARGLLEKARRLGVKLMLPVDHACSGSAEGAGNRTLVNDPAIPQALVGLDIGPGTAAAFAVELRRGKTVLWNGPLGRCELERFGDGTRAVARALGEVKGVAVAVGDDTAEAARRAGLGDGGGAAVHVSDAGEAGLELLGGRQLPAVQALGG